MERRPRQNTNDLVAPVGESMQSPRPFTSDPECGTLISLGATPVTGGRAEWDPAYWMTFPSEDSLFPSSLLLPDHPHVEFEARFSTKQSRPKQSVKMADREQAPFSNTFLALFSKPFPTAEMKQHPAG